MLESAFAAMFKEMPEAVWLLSPDGVVLACNPAASDALGIDETGQVDRQFSAFLESKPEVFAKELVRARRETRLESVLLTLSTENGKRECLAEVSRIQFDGRDAFLVRCDLYKWAARRLHQISQHLEILQQNLLEQKRREFKILSRARDADRDRRRFQDEAMRDSLTNLPNRRAFKRQLLDLWQSCRRDQLPLAMIMLDVDHFKRYNDHFGHPGGDRCLVEVGRALGEALHRDQDFVARIGGEEFAVLLPNCDIDGAATVAERLRVSVLDRQIAHAPDTGEQFVSISIGCAVGHPRAEIDSGLISHLADELLYQAKSAGRNRVRVGAIEADWSGVVPVLQAGPSAD